MSVLCFLHFFTKLIYPFLEIVSRICPELFHVRNLSIWFFTMSRICPGLTVQNLSKILYRTNTGRILDKVRTCQNFKYQKCVRHVPKKWTFSGHIRFIPDIFQTFLITFSGHLFFIGWLIRKNMTK